VLLADHTIRKNVKASGGDPDRLRLDLSAYALTLGALLSCQ